MFVAQWIIKIAIEWVDMTVTGSKIAELTAETQFA